jgi:hypothetical protein
VQVCLLLKEIGAEWRDTWEGGSYKHLYISIIVINIVVITVIRIDFSLLHNVQTGSGIHPASYTMDTGSKAVGDAKLTIRLNLEPRLMMVELYLHSPIYFYGAVRN